MSANSRKRLAALAFILPGLSGFLLFYVWAVLLCSYYSFGDSLTHWRFVGLYHYKALLASPAFVLAVKNTVCFLAVGIPLLLGLSILLAFSLWYMLGKLDGGWADFLFSSYLLPMVLPAGMVQLVLPMLPGIRRLLDSDWAFAVLLLVFLWRNTGYTVVVLYADLCGMGKEMMEAARVDGANYRQCVLQICLPCMRRGLLFAAVMGAAGGMKVYRDSYFLFGEYPPEGAYMLQNFLTHNYNSLNYIRLSAAGLLFVIVLSLPVALLIRRMESEV